MNRQVYKKFIRAAAAMVRACGEIHELGPILDKLPQDLASANDRELIIFASAYVNALEHLVEKMTDEFIEGRNLDFRWDSRKAAKLLKCFASGHVPNRL